MIQALLVEDDPDLLELATAFLEMAGCDVTPVTNPQEAISQLEERQNFDMLFTDFRLPGNLTGIELADRAKSALPELKVIVASGFDRQSLSAQSSRDYYFLQKPYRLADLQRVVGNLFSQN